MKKVGIYYRVSTDKQDFASQDSAIDDWLKALPEDRRPQDVFRFSDEGISGKTLNRPGLQQILDAAYQKKIDTVIVYKLDRLSRNATSAIRLILNLDDAGVAFISVSQPVLNLGHENPFRRTMLAAFAEIAEIERETIVARVKAGLDAAKRRGVKLGAPKKFNTEDEQKVLELRKDGWTVRKIAKEVGFSVGTVSKIINQAKNVQPTG